MGLQNPEVVTISIVLYKNDPKHISQLCVSLMQTTTPLDVYFIDNSPSQHLAQYIPIDSGYTYSWNNKNLGYGKAHNSVLEKTLDSGVYHLVMNPDVYFASGTIEKIVNFLDQREGIGLLLPRVLNPDNSEQPLFKLLPKPEDLLIRRFIPSFLKSGFEKSLHKYKMSFADSRENFDAPYLSGCFMFFRKEALKDVGIFDLRFFLYCEDIDLSRRVRYKWRTTYYAQASIYHYFYKGSYKHLKLLYYHLISAFKYFNKYGWFVDHQRDIINKETIEAFESVPQRSVVYQPTK